MEVIVGTYEEFVVGYKLVKSNEADGSKKYSLVQSFANHAHTGSVRTVAHIGKFLASGGADNGISLINMKTRTEHGSIKQQSGIITCLESFNPNFLFSGCEDGTICIWKAGSWICEKTLKAHNGGVLGISIHPSGKLALSIGKDKTIKTWNLIKGRHAFITNLKAVPDAIKFSPKGTLYAISITNRVDVYSIETAQVVYSFPFSNKRANCLDFLEEDILVVGGDKPDIEIHSISKSKKLTSFDAHKNRVKDMKYLPEKRILVTASNDGFIKLWKFNKNDNEFSNQPSLHTQVDVGCRIICLEILFESKLENAKEAENEKELVDENEDITVDQDQDESSESEIEEDEESEEEMDQESENEEDNDIEFVEINKKSSQKKQQQQTGLHGKPKRKRIQ